MSSKRELTTIFNTDDVRQPSVRKEPIFLVSFAKEQFAPHGVDFYMYIRGKKQAKKFAKSLESIYPTCYITGPLSQDTIKTLFLESNEQA